MKTVQCATCGAWTAPVERPNGETLCKECYDSWANTGGVKDEK